MKSFPGCSRDRIDPFSFLAHEGRGRALGFSRCFPTPSGSICSMRLFFSSFPEILTALKPWSSADPPGPGAPLSKFRCGTIDLRSIYKSPEAEELLVSKENDMFPQTLESWIYLLIACFVGFVIGEWIKNRRGKVTPMSKSTNQKESTHQGKHISKKSRRKSRSLLKWLLPITWEGKRGISTVVWRSLLINLLINMLTIQ